MPRRYLSASEVGLGLSGVGPVVAAAHLSGTLDARILARALATLAAESPLLRSQVVGEELRVGDDHRPGLVVRDGGEQALLAEINTPLPCEGGARHVGRAVLFRDGGDSVLMLRVDHAFADGRLCTTLLHKLLSHYTALATGRPVQPVRTGELEPPLDARLRDRYDHFAGLPDLPALPPDPALLPTIAAGGSGSAGCGVRDLRFGQAATTGMITAARRAGLSVHALLSGALAAALHGELEPVAGPVKLIVSSSVDLRARLEPPVSPEAELNCVGDVPAVVTVTAPADPIDLGRQVMTQVRAGIAQEVPQRRFAMAFGGVGRQIASPPSSLAISNLGRLTSPAMPGGLRITAIRFFTTVPGPTPNVFVTTVDGRLTLDVTYQRDFLTEEQILRWTGRVRAILDDLAGIGPGA